MTIGTSTSQGIARFQESVKKERIQENNKTQDNIAQEVKREDRVEEIKKQIEDGSYKISIEKTSQAILNVLA